MHEVFRKIILECPLLHFLCAYGDMSNIDEFISLKYLNYIDSEDETPLIKAVEFKNYDIVMKLLKYGADPYIVTKCGYTALSTSCSNGDYESTLILLNAGVDPNNNSIIAQIPIICACNTGNIKVIELLLENKADPNMIDMYGNSALLFAIKNKRTDIIKLLVKYGAVIHNNDLCKLQLINIY